MVKLPVAFPAEAVLSYACSVEWRVSRGDLLRRCRGQLQSILWLALRCLQAAPINLHFSDFYSCCFKLFFLFFVVEEGGVGVGHLVTMLKYLLGTASKQM